MKKETHRQGRQVVVFVGGSVRHSWTLWGGGGWFGRTPPGRTAVVHMTENKCDLTFIFTHPLTPPTLTKMCTPATTPLHGLGDGFLNKPSHANISCDNPETHTLGHTRDVDAGTLETFTQAH